jgi:maleylacetoacetate isomerase
MPETIELYTVYPSPCAARLRIALALKNLAYTPKYIDIFSDAQNSSDYAAINPSRSVPTLRIIPSSNPSSSSSAETETLKPITITQSVSALEYLDEAYPETIPLLPPVTNPLARAAVRTLVQILAADVQPVTNKRILDRVESLSSIEDRKKWTREVTTEGFRAYEGVLENWAGKYSVGDEITMADCCLAPAVWGAKGRVECREFPRMWRVYERLMEREEVKRAHWRCQGDTPEGERRGWKGL